MRFPELVCAIAVAVALGLSAPANVTIQFDYSLDANNFFANADARSALERAGQLFSDRFLDNLSAITPGGINTWSISFSNPATGNTTSIQNPTINASEVRIYVGGRSLGGSTLGMGGPGGYSVGGTSDWVDTVKSRGQSGALLYTPTDFGPWGGAISFSSDINWYFGLGGSGLAGDQIDFLSVATHELAHVFGFGTAGSYNALAQSGQFTGPKADAVYSNLVPLDAATGYDHWAAGVTCPVVGGTQEAAMSPSISYGDRKRFTMLDFAGMDDLAWDLAVGGDTNADGMVNIADLGSFAQHWQATGDLRWLDGDFNYDGIVNIADLGILAQRWQWGTGSEQLAELASVPEPSCAALILVGALSVCLRRRK